MADPIERRRIPRRSSDDHDDCVHCSQEGKIDSIYRVLVGDEEHEGMASQVRRITSQHDQMRLTLYGNGKMGLTETVRWMKWVIVSLGGGIGSIGLKLFYDYLARR